MHILLVEDDVELAGSLRGRFHEQGYEVDHCIDGEAGLASACGTEYQVIVLDRMLPRLDGLNFVRRLRERKVTTPVIYLTTMSGIDDRVQGLEAGGDDYLVKPFAFAELLARINALARRPPLAQAPTVLKVADLEMDLISRKVRRAGQEVDLQPREFRLLEYLMRNAGRVVTRTMLLENVW